MTLTYADIDTTILKSLPNPSSEFCGAYEMKIKIPECTFLGVKNQPDFATLYMTFYPQNFVIELKSLKEYIFQFRNIVISYERFSNEVYEDIMLFYQPVRYRQVAIFNPRGGISSKIVIDSDWAVRGGKELFSDWKANVKDEWSVEM